MSGVWCFGLVVIPVSPAAQPGVARVEMAMGASRPDGPRSNLTSPGSSPQKDSCMSCTLSLELFVS